jgi:hypothetical protein
MLADKFKKYFLKEMQDTMRELLYRVSHITTKAQYKSN